MKTHTPLRKSRLVLILALSMGVTAQHSVAETLVKLDATQLTPGPLETWVNTGTISSNFTSAGAQIPVVANIAGVNAVEFIGTGGGAGGTHYAGPVAPPSVTGTNGRTVEAWVWDPAAQGEKVIFGWGRRGADNINCSFNHGTDAAFGAVGHWGGGPDIGWGGQITFNNWTHIVYTYDPYTFVKSVYKDGQLANRETNSLAGNNGPPFVPLNTASINDAGTTPLRFRVARQNNGNGTPSGTGVGTNYIARIRVHDVALHPTTVRATYFRELCDFAPLGVSCVDDDADGFPNWYESLFPGCLDPAVSNPPGNDCDSDGATDMEEYQNRSLVNVADTDGDGVSDGAEIHRAAGATDPANPDSDGDNLSDGVETGTGTYISTSDTGTNPLSRDSDGDTITDPFELSYIGCLDPNVNDAGADCDNDGLSNLAELENRTFPTDPDSDDDTLTDGTEVNRLDGGLPAPTNPLRADTDADGLSDAAETDTGVFVSAADTGTDPISPDSDGDGYTDGVEVRRNSNPTDPAGPAPDLETPLINLDATTLALGPLSTWQNTGLLPGNFNAGGTLPQVTQVQNINGVTLDGANNTGGYYTGPGAPEWISGTNGRTVEAWIFNPTAADEETIFSWSRRGGPDGANMSFNHGLNATFGAVGHWGPGPDIGWGSPTNVAQGRWTHVAYTYNPHTLEKTLYTDGRLANIETNSLNAANGPPFVPLNTWAVDSAGAPLPFRVGSQNEANGNPTGNFRGGMTIARLRVYEVALSQAAIDAKFAVEAEEFGQDDRDSDGLPTWFERLYAFLDPTNPGDAALDQDTDGLTNLEEYQSNTLPDDADTDDDGATDTAEVRRLDNGLPAPTNPRRPDTDQDGLLDSVETDTGVYVSATDTGSDPLVVDSDGDRFADGQEIIHESNPNDQFNTPDFEFTDPVAVINLDATSLALGPLSVWPNTGALPGNFPADAHVPEVVRVDNVRGVMLNGLDDFFTGPVTPLYMTGTNSRTVEAWIHNPAVAGEENIFAWGRRGGPDGSNLSFNHGTDPNFGAVGHWGAGPDIGWAGAISISRWTHVTYTYDTISQVVRVYHDGLEANTEVVTNINTHAVDSLGNPLLFRVATQNEANGSATPGLRGSMTIARIRVYDEALTADDVLGRFASEQAYFFRCPTADSQSVATDQRTPLAIALSATDPQGDTLSYTIVTPPAYGTLSGTPPNLTYTPSSTECTGSDSFRFRVDDGSNDAQCDSAFASVSITVTCNNCPVAGSQSITTQGPTIINLSYSDPDSDPLTISITSPPAHGSYDLNTSTYTPNSGYGGPDSFTFTVDDGLCSASGTVGITVLRPNGAPACVAQVTPSDCGVTFPSGGKLYAIAVKRDYVCLALDGSGSTDPDGDPLSISWLIDGTNLVAGTVVTNCLDVGCHTITMVADDGRDRCFQFMDICVIEPSEAVEQCIALVESSSLERKKKRPLLVSLKAAKAAFDRQGWRAGNLMLRVFEFKVYAQVWHHSPAEAASFIQCAENISKAIQCVVKNTPRKGDDDGDDDDDRTRDDDDNGGPRNGDDDDGHYGNRHSDDDD